MSAVLDEEIKRWTARRKSALVLEIIQGKTTVAEASRQVDQLDRLVRTIAASSDVIAVGGGGPLHGATLPTLGEAVFTAAGGIRDLLDQIEAQRLAEAPD